MDSNKFKKIFGDVAANYNFKRVHGGWAKETPECVTVVDLQKSNFDNYFLINVKTYIHYLFGYRYDLNKSLVKTDTGDIFTRAPEGYRDAVDLSSTLTEMDRAERLERFFNEFVVPFAENTRSRDAIVNAYRHGALFLLPAVKAGLGIE